MSEKVLEFGVLSGAAERQQLATILAESFNLPLEFELAVLNFVGDEPLRVVRREGEVLGGLLGIPMGQFWGGRSVRLYGVGGVGIAPHARGSGVATRLMSETLREARAQGYALSALYPATQPLYRRVGYEQAGVRCELRVPLIALPSGGRETALRPFTPEALPAIQSLYRETARTRQGWLDRGSYIWNRVQNPRMQKATGYVLEEAGQLRGYVFLTKAARQDNPFFYDLHLTDLCARTEADWRRMLGFLGGYTSMARDMVWHGGTNEPLLLLLREQYPVSLRLLFHWMLRVLDVPAALSARGYPRGLSATLHLEVEDGLLPDNTGRWVLEVAGGEARVRRGGEGHLRCDARGLSALYAGLRSASALASVGALQGTPEALEEAEVLFSGMEPSTPDMY
jgi:predicted acetyltransferase